MKKSFRTKFEDSKKNELFIEKLGGVLPKQLEGMVINLNNQIGEIDEFIELLGEKEEIKELQEKLDDAFKPSREAIKDLKMKLKYVTILLKERKVDNE